MEMLRTFNNGIGAIVIINEKHEKEIITEIQKSGYKGYKIGVVKGGNKDKVTYKGDFNA